MTICTSFLRMEMLIELLLAAKKYTQSQSPKMDIMPLLADKVALCIFITSLLRAVKPYKSH